MHAISDIKTLEEFREFKVHEAIPYIYQTISKSEDKIIGKETLKDYMNSFNENIQNKLLSIFESILHVTISEDDFKMILRNLEFGNSELVILYQRYLEKFNKKTYDHSIFGDINPRLIYSKIFDKLDDPHKGRIDTSSVYRYLNNKKISMENLKNDVCEAFVRMEANKTGGEVSKQTFVKYCKGNCIKGFDQIIFEIINVEGLNQNIVNEKISAMNIPEDLMKKYSECFKLFDISKEGSFTKNNFDTFFKSVQSDFSKQDIAKIFKEMHGEKDTHNAEVDKVKFFSYIMGKTCDNKLLECLDKIHAQSLISKDKQTPAETEEQFKRRIKITEESFQHFNTIFEFFKKCSQGEKLEFSFFINLCKKYPTGVPSGVDISKSFKEMNKKGTEDNEASKFEFIEYMNCKKNLKFQEAILGIYNLEKTTKNATTRQKAIEKALEPKKASEKVSIDPNQSKVDYFYDQIVKKSRDGLKMENLKEYIDTKKINKFFSNLDLKNLFEKEKRIKRESISAYYQKNKNFKILFDKVTEDFKNKNEPIPSTSGIVLSKETLESTNTENTENSIISESSEKDFYQKWSEKENVLFSQIESKFSLGVEISQTTTIIDEKKVHRSNVSTQMDELEINKSGNDELENIHYTTNEEKLLSMLEKFEYYLKGIKKACIKDMDFPLKDLTNFTNSDGQSSKSNIVNLNEINSILEESLSVKSIVRSNKKREEKCISQSQFLNELNSFKTTIQNEITN